MSAWTPPGAALAELGARVAVTLARLREARGVSVGDSPRRAVWSYGRTTLYRYLPPAGQARSGALPLLICFALVNRPYVLDLQPERSLIRRLLEAGLDVHLLDWGDPEEGGRTGLGEYILEHLGGGIRHLRAQYGVPAVDLLGVCQGGVLSLCYSALRPAEVAHLVTLTTPVDFHTPDNLLSAWMRGLDTRLIEALGQVPGALLNGLFLSLMPLRLAQEKYVRLLTGHAEAAAVEDFVRMEKWIFDSPPQAGTALAQFMRWFYQENRLVRGTLEIGGAPVRLAAVRQPVLNLYALQDHIVPPSASRALGRHVGARRYSEHGVASGHIGMYVSRAARDSVPQRISAWLQAGRRRRPVARRR